MKTTVKFHTVLAAVTACAMLLPMAGCAAISPKKPVSIELWHYYNGPQQVAFTTLVTDFNETVGKEQGITIMPSGLGDIGQLTQAVLDSAEKKVGAPPLPAIFAAYSDTAFEVNKMGLVASLDSYLTPTEQKAYLPGYLDEGRFDADGSLKIFPIAKSTEIMLVNKTDWDKFATATGTGAESLTTMEGITAAAGAYYNWTDSLTPAKDDGKAFFGRDAMANFMLVGCRQQGIELFAVKDGQMTMNLDATALRRLWDNFYIPYINGYFAHFGRFRTDDIKTGDIIAQVGSIAGAAYFPGQVLGQDNSGYDIEMMVLEAPRLAGSAAIAVQQGAGMVVTKSDPSTEEAAVTFLKWFTKKDQNLRFALDSGYLPVTTEGASPKALETYLAAHPESTLTPGMVAVLSTALKTCSTHEMYTSKAFAGSNAARGILEKSLIQRTQADREQVVAVMATGKTREEATARFVTDAYFEDWYSSLQASLEAATSNQQ